MKTMKADQTTVPVNAEPTKEDTLKLLYKLHVEIFQMRQAKVRLDFRVKRLDDITGRVKFTRKSRDKQLRAIRRLTSAKRELTGVLADINSFETEVRNIQTSLGVGQ